MSENSVSDRNRAGTRPPIPPDAEAGIRWFNALTRDDRSTWLRLAGSSIPADAWTLRNRLRRGPRGGAV